MANKKKKKHPAPAAQPAEKRFQLGAALGAERQIAAAADVKPLQVALRQAVPDQVKLIIFHGMFSLSSWFHLWQCCAAAQRCIISIP